MNNRNLLVALALLALVTIAIRAHAQDNVSPADFEARFFVHLPQIVGSVGTPIPTVPPTSPIRLPFDPTAIRSGEGTYYNADGRGNCSFDASPGDLLVAAINTPDYHDSLLCGAFIEVSGPNGTVTVRVVDRCPECAQGDVDMSSQAFERVAPLVAGRVPITWRLLSPAISGDISYKFKEGSNQWWTAVQIRNHRNPIYRVEYRTAAGTWQPMVRQNYNYFLAESGLGTGPAVLRVTDIYGNTIIDTGLAWTAGAVLPGSAQFPGAP